MTKTEMLTKLRILLSDAQEVVYLSNMNKRGIIPDPVMWGG